MIDRIFSGAVTRGPVIKFGKMTYTEFVWFLISEEDKHHPRAIEYWFRCMDLDGDGFLSMYELEWFYSEQARRLEAMGIEALPFNDTLCQVRHAYRSLFQSILLPTQLLCFLVYFPFESFCRVGLQVTFTDDLVLYFLRYILSCSCNYRCWT